jgi:hypothetical protein
MAQEKNFSDEQNYPKAEFQQNFNGETLDTANIKPSPQKSSPKRERIKHLLIGSPKAVTSTIHLLQMQGGCKRWRLESTTTNWRL